MEQERKIVVIIPCFNESERFKIVNWEAEFKQYPWVDFLFINDGSTDNTAQL